MIQRITLILILILSTVALSGCGQSAQPTAPSPTLAATRAAPTASPIPPTSTVELPTSTPPPAPNATPVPPTSTPLPALTATPVSPTPTAEAVLPFAITSPAFVHETEIPLQYTCDGEDTSPPLEWSAPPSGAASLALIVDDPDAPMGTWVHWVIYNLPAEARGLPAGITPDAELPDGSRQGNNSWPKLGYGGPCPPSGSHRYVFKLYALDAVLDVRPGATEQQLLQAMEGHILAEAQLMGTYAHQ